MKNGYCTRTMPQLIPMLMKRAYSTAEIKSIFGLSQRQKSVVMAQIRNKAELEITKDSNNTYYKIIKLRTENLDKQKQVDYVVGLPQEVSHNELVDWYLAQEVSKVNTIKDLYNLAQRNNIRVYRQTKEGRKYIV